MYYNCEPFRRVVSLLQRKMCKLGMCPNRHVYGVLMARHCCRSSRRSRRMERRCIEAHQLYASFVCVNVFSQYCLFLF